MKKITKLSSIILLTALFLSVSLYGENAALPLSLKKRVLVLEGTATSKYFNRSTSAPLSIMWSNFLKQKNALYEIVSQEQFVNKDLRGYDILILPFILCVSDREIEKIKEFARYKEKGLILDGFTGARDENGGWRQVSFLSEILGGDSIKEIKGEGVGGAIANLILDGTSRLIADVEPGFRLELNTYNRPVTANIIEPRSEIDGFWESTPAIYQNKLSSEEAGLVHGKYLEARFAWLGFTMGSVVGDIPDQKIFQKVIDNIFSYVSFWPLIYKERWPEGKKGAAIFAQDTEDKFENALNTVSLLTAKNIPATFFCVPEMAAKYDKVFAKIYARENFEVGLHGLDVYQGQTLELQRERLRSGKSILEKITGKRVRGFRPPEAIYDRNTLLALVNLEYDYMAGDDIKQSCPEIMPDKKNQERTPGRNQEALVKFPKTSDDDYDLIERYKMRDKNKMLELLKKDFDKIYQIGGLYYYSFHTQIMAKEEYIDVLGKFIDYVKEKDCWIASFSEVNDWWLNRYANIKVTGVQTGPTRTFVNITNNSFQKASGVKINLLLPPSRRPVKIIQGTSGPAVPFYEGKDGNIVVEIQNIESGESIAFNFEYE